MHQTKQEMHRSSKAFTTIQHKESCMKKVLPVLALSAGVIVLFGCSGKNPVSNNSTTGNYALVSSYEDASSQDIATDVAAMSESFAFASKSAALSKKASDVTGTIQWQSWTYANGWWLRNGQVTVSSSDGTVDLQGSDSVQFTDANNAAVQYPLLADVRGGAARHHAAMHVAATAGGYVDALRDWALEGTITKAADTTLTLSGSLSQSFKAQNAAKTASCDFQGAATATDIVYSKQGDGWSKPVSGTVVLVSPYKTIDITFNSGTAHIVVTAKDGTVTKDVTITL
jgi:hypothetical protein